MPNFKAQQTKLIKKIKFETFLAHKQGTCSNELYKIIEDLLLLIQTYNKVEKVDNE